MKANFKPKLWTKKEWQDNRARAANGSGVGKALDAWQKDCPTEISKMTKAEVGIAFKTAKKLDSCFDVATKKCNPKSNKETIAGIGVYKKKIQEYLSLLKKAAVSLDKREKLSGSLNLDVVCKDAGLVQAFTHYAQKKGFFYEQLHTHFLIQKKQYEKAVKLYGKDNDYNVSDRTNKVLLATFGGSDRGDVDIKKVKLAVTDMAAGMRKMLGDQRHYDSFAKYPQYHQVLHQKFPINDFVI